MNLYNTKGDTAINPAMDTLHAYNEIFNAYPAEINNNMKTTFQKIFTIGILNKIRSLITKNWMGY